jgi:hypothetical protein
VEDGRHLEVGGALSELLLVEIFDRIDVVVHEVAYSGE